MIVFVAKAGSDYGECEREPSVDSEDCLIVDQYRWNRFPTTHVVQGTTLHQMVTDCFVTEREWEEGREGQEANMAGEKARGE